MSARERIFAAVRASLGRDRPLPRTTITALEQRQPSLVQPKIGSQLLDVFVQNIVMAGGTVERVGRFDEVGDAVATYLKSHQLPNELILSSDPIVSDIEWPALISTKTGAPGGQEMVSVTGALVAVAETGTLVLVSGEHTPTSLNFLPDDHIVVLPESRVVGHLEDAWVALRGVGDMPRAVNLISGPSKTGDVELTLVQGAHGPRRLHVLFYQDRIDRDF